MDDEMTLGQLHTLIDRMLQWQHQGRQDARTTAIGIIHMIANERLPSAILHFLEASPEDTQEAAAVELNRLRDMYNFSVPAYNIGYISPERAAQIRREREPVYRQMYDMFFSAVSGDGYDLQPKKE